MLLAQKLKEQKDKELYEATAVDREEAEKEQRAIDITQRKMLAKQYESMMIEDEKKEGIDNGGSSFQILADQQAEQNYAINVYKGSGNMSNMLDDM